MAKLDAKKTAIALGLFIAVFKILWLAVFAIGGQEFLNWVMSIHFVSMPATLATFAFGTAAISVVFHFVVGAIAGWLFATVWNRFGA